MRLGEAVSVEGSAGNSSRVAYLYDGQMPVCEQEFVGSTLRTSRVNFLGARGIEAVLTIDHTRGNQTRLNWLLYDGHGNLVRVMASDYTLSGFQWRGVWGEVQSSLGAGRGYCANLGHSEDETGLVYMRARYYEPLTGRFISEDPARDGVNWYLYADGNPVNKVDVDGRSAVWLGVIAAIWGVISFLWSPSDPYYKAAKTLIDGLFVTLGLIETIQAVVAYSPQIAADPRLLYAAAGAVYALAGAAAVVTVLTAYQLTLILLMASDDDPYWRNQAGDPLSYFQGGR